MTIWAQCILPPKWGSSGESSRSERDPITIKEIVIPHSETDTASNEDSNDKHRDVEQGSPSITPSGDKNAPISLVSYNEFDDISEMTPNVVGNSCLMDGNCGGKGNLFSDVKKSLTRKWMNGKTNWERELL